MDILNALLGITGGAAVASLLTLWLSPHACRWTAALLLVQASSVEAQREERARAWQRLDETLEYRRRVDAALAALDAEEGEKR